MTVILSKNLNYTDGVFYITEIDLSNETLLNYGNDPQVRPSLILGRYTGGLDFTDAEAGDKGYIVSFQPNIYNSSLRSINLNLSFNNVDNYSSNISGIFVTTLSSNNDIVDYDFVSDFDYSDLTPQDLSFQGSAFFDITDRANIQVSSPAWTTGSWLHVGILPTGENEAIRYSTVNSCNITYYAREPFVVENFAASGDGTSIILSWDDPIDDGGSPINSYNIDYADITDGPSDWQSITIDPPTDNEYILADLADKRQFLVRIAAANNVGIGDLSNILGPITTKKTIPATAFTFNDANYTRIRLRRDTAANWSGNNPTLALGEAGYETDTRLLKVGDNISDWSELGYVKVENSSIDFPEPPDQYLTIGDSPVNADSPRVICNISENQKLNIVGDRGITVEYNNNYKSVTLSLNQVFEPFNSGTIVSPTTRGRPGSVYYDDNFMYVCTSPNYWKRLSLFTDPWFAADALSISNSAGYYPSQTNFYFSGTNFMISSDGDPYPAKASSNLVNDGISPRSDFYKNYRINEQDYNFIVYYRGGTNTQSPEIAQTGINGIMNNGPIFGHPNAGNESIDIYPPPENFHYNRVFFNTYFKIDACGGFVDYGRRYIYYHGGFLKNCWSDSKVYDSNDYYSDSNYNNDYFRHNDGHSKIVGFCFDGYPVYGPFGYTNSENPEDGISLMTSSYIAKENDSHRPLGWKYTNAITVNDINYTLTAGAFIEDYEYAEGSGILDQYNGRYAVTPEYPQGTYAYFLTFTDDSLLIPKYPYIIGNYSKNIKINQQLSTSLNPLTVDGYYPVFTNIQSAVNYGLLHGANGSYTTYQILSDTYYMPNDVYQEFPSTPSDIILSSDSISEKATLNSIIGTFSTVDDNFNDTFTYELVPGDNSTDNANFTIVNNELRVNSVLSNGAQNIHSIRVRSTDQTNRFVEKAFDIQVLAGTTLVSLNITNEITSLIANDTHIFGTTIDGTATDVTYTWYIYGSPYVTSSDYTQSSLNISSENINERNDETINIYVTAKSISAFNSLTVNTSFVLDHSENPVCIDGYYPLYASEYDSDRDPNGDGTSHIHTVQGVVYYMPNGLDADWHGDYDCNSLT